jgi:pyridoxamine 5'-phosphate oxidase
MTHSIDNILAEFHVWLQEAQEHPHVTEPTAMNLATVDAKGNLSSRMVLLKLADTSGFTFFTNYESVKGKALDDNPQGALNFYWMPLKKQIRIEGKVSKTDAATSNAYFATRPRESQLAALASCQSRVIASHHELIARFEALCEEYDDEKPIVRPAQWGGYVLVPSRIEFWEERPHRLHNRYEFVREGDAWVKHHLNP